MALVYQQHAVLKANLDQEVEFLCGQMGTDLWDREVWDTYFKKSMAIVCTADVLHHCLLHAFVTMAQVNLLVFDEAHHAKNDHPYARSYSVSQRRTIADRPTRIIRDFYVPLRTAATRPRIFGMTASPVDGTADDDMVSKARQVSRLFHGP